MKMTPITLFVLAAAVCLAALRPDRARADAQQAAEFKRLADEMDQHLEKQILSLWYPRAVDYVHGGFLENFDEQWRPAGSQTQRSIVYQSRLTWVAAEVAKRYPKRAAEYRKYALHGVKALQELMWDKEKGGL